MNGSALSDLYGEVILDHSRHPRHFGKLPEANRTAHGNNPLCGDQFTVYAEVEGNRIRNISFEGSGCAISTASASLMSEALSGKTLEEARALHDSFQGYLTSAWQGSSGTSTEPPEALGKLAALGGVRQFPMRVKCATLAWHALRSALAGPAPDAASPPNRKSALPSEPGEQSARAEQADHAGRSGHSDPADRDPAG